MGVFGGLRNPTSLMGLDRRTLLALLTVYPLGVLWWMTQAALVVGGTGIGGALTAGARLAARNPGACGLFILADACLLVGIDQGLSILLPWTGWGAALVALTRCVVIGATFVLWTQTFTVFHVSRAR